MANLDGLLRVRLNNMPLVSVDRLSQLQHNPTNIRNICILAHIDHGKTTLSDLLIASNGIISNKLAGKLRYLDCREDEQQRGITMKSSAISLLYRDGAEKESSQSYLINLIDSPGHVDFSSEVSTSLRLCDGALVLVDALEGVCSQTREVLRQAWHERVRPILMINKIDRLVIELQNSPLEAYKQLKNIVDEMNVIMSTFVSADWMASEEALKEGEEQVIEHDITLNESQVYFRPEIGNVIFGSAVDGWAFTLPHFAKLYAQKLSINESVLARTLWGDFFYDPSSKKIYTGKKASSLKLYKPLFVQCVLENVWAIYTNTILISRQQQLPKETLERMAKAISMKLLPSDFTSKDVKALTRKMLSTWLPLAKNLLHAVAEHLPSPKEAQHFRLKKILLSSHHGSTENHPMKEVIDAMASCDASPSAPVVVYVSKMFSRYHGHANPGDHRLDRPIIFPQDHPEAEESTTTKATGNMHVLPDIPMSSLSLSHTDTKQTLPTSPDSQAQNLIGFARIFSGILHAHADIYLLHPKYTFNHPIHGHAPHIEKITLGQLYLLMGRDVEPLKEVPAGNILGIGGLDFHVLKTATLSSSVAVPNFHSLSAIHHHSHLVQVAVSPANPLCLSQLTAGLRILHLADPAVHVSVKKSTGEYLISAAGELHLARCLKDLEEEYSQTPLKTSPPIVHYRETVKGSAVSVIDTDTHRIQLSAHPLPKGILDFMLHHDKDLLADLHRRPLTRRLSLHDDRNTSMLKEKDESNESIEGDHVEKETTLLMDTVSVQEKSSSLEFEGLIEDESRRDSEASISVENSEDDLQAALERLIETHHGWKFGNLDRWLSVGAEEEGLANVLVHQLPEKMEGVGVFSSREQRNASSVLSPVLSSLVAGFKMAVAAGPLCGEPWMGVVICVDAIEEKDVENKSFSSGQLMSCVKSACLEAILKAQPRLMLSMYDCVIQTDANALGRMYSVIARRHGQVLSSDGRDGTSLFDVKSRLPVVESFGFADELRKKTSGIANPQLLFGGWEMLDQDPLEDKTAVGNDEKEGENDLSNVNYARKYMIQVRKRKGLQVDEKLIEHAEKQRTLKRS